MAVQFSTNEDAEVFLSEQGVAFQRLQCYSPVVRRHLPYWRVQLGTYPCDVYNLMEWANTVYARKIR